METDAIDPSVYVDINSTPYLLWKNEGSAQIMSQQLSVDGGSLVGEATNIFNPDASWIGNGVENPQMVLLGGGYVLLFSFNFWASVGYATGEASCAGPQGPCQSAAPVLSSHEFGQGTGGLTVFLDSSGARRAAYHAWVGGVGYEEGGYRALFIGYLSTGPDGVSIAHGLRSASENTPPTGAIDVATTTEAGEATLSGWALDHDRDVPLQVHAYVDGKLAQVAMADRAHVDVGRVMHVDPRKGFTLQTPPGRVCVYAINAPAGANVLLGCRDVGREAPIGAFDLAEPGASGVRLAGWAFDPDAVGTTLAVHVYVDGRLVGGIDADRERLDVAAAFRGAGEAHGFDATVAMAPGAHTVCLYAINTGPGVHTPLGCKKVSGVTSRSSWRHEGASAQRACTCRARHASLHT